MSKIKKISFILVMVALSGCASQQTANQFLPTVNKVGEFAYGGWIVAEVKGDLVQPDTISGELISITDHKLYILGTRQMNVIPDSNLSTARLYMYKKQPGLFAILTLIGILPNIIAAIALPEYGGQFLLLGILPLVSGTVFTISEASSKRNQLIFPHKDSLEQFNKFSRFPQGIPTGMDIYQLKLPYKNHRNKTK